MDFITIKIYGEDMSDEQDCHENGFCPSHEAEVERRKLSIDELSAIKGRMSELLSFKNRLMGFGAGISIFATVVILGSYTYTYNHMQDARSKYEDLEKQTKKVEDVADVLRRESYDTRVQLARTDERYQALQLQLKSIDSRLEQLLNKIETDKR